MSNLGAWKKPLVLEKANANANTNIQRINESFKQDEKMLPPKPVVGLFPNLSKLKNDSEELLKFKLATTTPISKLKLASNCFYSLYINDKFIADGGNRCSPKGVIVDNFVFDAVTNIYILLHYIGEKNSVWHRMIFPDPFFCDLDTSHNWICEKCISYGFGAKISSQLPRQNIIHNIPEKFERIELFQLKNFDWKFIERDFQFIYRQISFNSDTSYQQQLPQKFPSFFQKTNFNHYNIQQILSFRNLQLKNGDNLMEVLHNISDLDVISYTLDTGAIGLHKLFVTTSEPLLVYYSEIGNMKDAWNTFNRNKVWMADAFLSNQSDISSIEWRGCRYLHIVTSKTCKFKINCVRKEYNFGWKKNQIKEQKYRDIYNACINNLIACTDGGIVDTCWRERAQWVGDAYMSLKAISLMCNNERAQPIIDNVLNQISVSYDSFVGMVQGAYPIKNPNHKEFCMPTYHLLWCLTVLEHNKVEYFDIVKNSLELWKKKYIRTNNLLEGMPGWNFVDWYTDNKGINCTGTQTGKDNKSQNITVANAFVNILYFYLCSKFSVETSVTQNAIESVFLQPDGYSLYPNTPACLQATSVAIIYLNTNNNIKQKFSNDVFNGLLKHTMYYGYFIAKALETVSKELQKKYIISKYWNCAKNLGTIIEKINDESSRAHGWSVGIVEFLLE